MPQYSNLLLQLGFRFNIIRSGAGHFFRPALFLSPDVKLYGSGPQEGSYPEPDDQDIIHLLITFTPFIQGAVQITFLLYHVEELQIQ